jgi:hypothetical protein
VSAIAASDFDNNSVTGNNQFFTLNFFSFDYSRHHISELRAKRARNNNPFKRIII